MPDHAGQRHLPPLDDAAHDDGELDRRWRKILTQHLAGAGAPGEGDHYPWKIYVNQITGERTVPPSR